MDGVCQKWHENRRVSEMASDRREWKKKKHGLTPLCGIRIKYDSDVFIQKDRPYALDLSQTVSYKCYYLI
jgi:hypothetical protein